MTSDTNDTNVSRFGFAEAQHALLSNVVINMQNVLYRNEHNMVRSKQFFTKVK